MHRQKLLINARSLKESFGPRLSHEGEQVLVALIILGQEHDARAFAINRLVVLKARARREVRIHAKNWLDTLSDRSFIELNSAMHVTAVGECYRTHIMFLCGFYQFLHLGQCLEEGVVAVSVKVDEA